MMSYGKIFLDQRNVFFKYSWGVLVFILLGMILPGCRSDSNEVVVYNSVDQLFSEPILQEFEKQTGIKVKAVFDTEETKSTGILNRLIAESAHPRCDVFWSGDPLRTQVLKKRGLLAIYQSPVAGDIDSIFMDTDHQWSGFSARARIILYNKNLVSPDSLPQSIMDLTHEKYRGKVAIANPLFGTTTFHLAALFYTLGEATAREFLQKLKENHIVICTSNGDVKRRVAEGHVGFGLTDTDDAFTALQGGSPVGIIYPDQNGKGTLVMPNTVSLMKGAPHAENGKKLIDFLLSKQTEEKLAASCAQIPLHRDAVTPPYIRPIDNIRAMQIEYNAVADLHESIQPFLQQWVENP